VEELSLSLLILISMFAIALVLGRGIFRTHLWTRSMRLRTAVLAAFCEAGQDLTTEDLIVIFSGGVACEHCAGRLTEALNELVSGMYLTRRDDGWYHLTSKGERQIRTCENQTHFVPVEWVRNFRIHEE
jgi:hypothetical protein